MRRLRQDQRITSDEACRRVIDCLKRHDGPVPPSLIANSVWPGNDMKAQGAAFAIAATLKNLERDGQIRHIWARDHHGWVLTAP